MKIFLKTMKRNPYKPGTRQFNTLEDIKEIVAINKTTTLDKLIEANKDTINDDTGARSEEIARQYYLHPEGLEALQADKIIKVRNT